MDFVMGFGGWVFLVVVGGDEEPGVVGGVLYLGV
jgi:hypothetical protein